jgi:hypothetical protein
VIGNPADPGPLAQFRDRITDGLTAPLQLGNDQGIMDDVLPTDDQNADK